VVLGQSRFDSGSAGGGTAGLLSPIDVTQDSGGNIFVSDSGNNRVVIYHALLSLLTGSRDPYLAIGQQNLQGSAPNWDTPDGLATPEGLVAPLGILVDRQGTLYVGDAGNNRVLHFLKPVSVVNAATLQAFRRRRDPGPQSAVGVRVWRFARCRDWRPSAGQG
jgi:hypothetical protein